MLDIGISAEGAFLRVQSGDGPLGAESIPKPPLRIFAGKDVTKVVDGDVKATGEYERFQTYAGAIEYVPNLVTPYGAGFVVVSKGDTQSFLEMVVRARGEFVVIQSTLEPKNVDVIAIYHFQKSTMTALLSCAKKHIE